MTTTPVRHPPTAPGQAPGPHGARARRDAVVRVVSGSSLWLSLLLVTYWWVAGGGVRDLGGLQSGLTSVGRISALMASDLLLVQVILMARVPRLERAFGQDRLTAQHRVVGFTSFNLMLVHVALITWGYAAGRVADTPGTWWNLTLDYPGMLLAVAGTGCLVMVVATSARAARRRLRYESWHLIHLYAYLGVGLALPHQLWTGQEFLTSRGATIFWWSAWALAAGTVLVWRIALPLWRTVHHELRVSSVVAEADGVVSVHVTGRHLSHLHAEAGQFFNWRFHGREGWTRANPYSLSAAPDGETLRITIKDSGDGSAAAAGLHPGTRVLVEGPYGRLSPRARSREKIVLIGAGVGVTPLRALAEGLAYRPGDAVLLQRFTSEPLFVAELDTLSRQRGLQVVHLPGRRRATGSWLGDGMGLHSDVGALLAWVPDLAARDVYVCGPTPWTDAVRRAVQAAGLPPEQLHVENFGW